MKNLLLAVSMTVVLTSPAFARVNDTPMGRGYGPGGMGLMCDMEGPGDGPWGRMGDMIGSCLDHADQLGLSDEQIDKLKPIHREMQKNRARFLADIRIAEIDQRGLMDLKDFDLDKAIAGVRKMADMRAAHQIDMLKSMKEVRAILTDQQFKKMRRLHKNMWGKKPGKKMMRK